MNATAIYETGHKRVPELYGDELPWCTEQPETFWTKNRRAHFVAAAAAIT